MQSVHSSEMGTIKMDRPCYQSASEIGHVTRMPDEHLPKKILYGELQVGNAPRVVRRSDTRTPSKPPLKIFQHTNRVMGTDCTGSSKVVRPHKKGCW